MNVRKVCRRVAVVLLVTVLACAAFTSPAQADAPPDAIWFIAFNRHGGAERIDCMSAYQFVMIYGEAAWPPWDVVSTLMDLAQAFTPYNIVVWCPFPRVIHYGRVHRMSGFYPFYFSTLSAWPRFTPSYVVPVPRSGLQRAANALGLRVPPEGRLYF